MLDIGFVLFHSALILFILLGWAWKRTRLANLVVNALTAFSWFILGICYGFGYCPCTDWHWHVRAALGHTDMPRSYIKFLIDTPTGLDVPAQWVDGVTVVLFFLAFGISAVLNLRDWAARRAAGVEEPAKTAD